MAIYFQLERILNGGKSLQEVPFSVRLGCSRRQKTWISARVGLV
jgi:hypothetical protein